MVCRPPYPWYIDPPIHGILTPLPMEYRPPYLWYYELLSFGRNEGGGGGVQNTMTKKLTLGSKYHMENLPWGSKNITYNNQQQLKLNVSFKVQRKNSFKRII